MWAKHFTHLFKSLHGALHLYACRFQNGTSNSKRPSMLAEPGMISIPPRLSSDNRIAGCVERRPQAITGHRFGPKNRLDPNISRGTRQAHRGKWGSAGAPEVLAGHDGAPQSTLRRWIHPMAETGLPFGAKTESTNRCAFLRSRVRPGVDAAHRAWRRAPRATFAYFISCSQHEPMLKCGLGGPMRAPHSASAPARFNGSVAQARDVLSRTCRCEERYRPRVQLSASEG
jgi:hypothetical protein